MKAIKFLSACTVGALYNAGEVAGFEDAVADDLIERGIAELVKADKGQAKADTKIAKARAELEAKSDEDLAQLITTAGLTIAEDADKAAKIEALLAAAK